MANEMKSITGLQRYANLGDSKKKKEERKKEIRKRRRKERMKELRTGHGFA